MPTQTKWVLKNRAPTPPPEADYPPLTQAELDIIKSHAPAPRLKRKIDDEVDKSISFHERFNTEVMRALAEAAKDPAVNIEIGPPKKMPTEKTPMEYKVLGPLIGVLILTFVYFLFSHLSPNTGAWNAPSMRGLSNKPETTELYQLPSAAPATQTASPTPAPAVAPTPAPLPQAWTNELNKAPLTEAAPQHLAPPKTMDECMARMPSDTQLSPEDQIKLCENILTFETLKSQQ